LQLSDVLKPFDHLILRKQECFRPTGHSECSNGVIDSPTKLTEV